MKRLLFLAVFFLTSTLFALAQNPEFSIGVSGGTVLSRFKVEREYDFGYNIDYIAGYNTAVILKIDLASGLFVETQLSFCENGYNENQEDVLDGLDHTFEDSYIGYEFENRYRYLNNMWFVGYTLNLTNKIDASASIGAYWGYLLGGESIYLSNYFLTATDAETIGDPVLSVGYYENIREESIEKSYYMDFDYGVGGRLSVIYRINSCMAIRASGGYRYGLKNILKPNGGWLKIYPRSINITAGVLVAI